MAVFSRSNCTQCDRLLAQYISLSVKMWIVVNDISSSKSVRTSE